MKKITKLALVGAGVVAGLGLGAAGIASAETKTAELPRGVQTIVEKFNLNEEEVVKVLAEDRTAHQAEMQAEFETKLTALVTEGKITQAQKDAIVAKHTELMANKTPGDREANRAKGQEFRTWLESQGIDETLIGLRGQGQGMGGQGRGMHRFQN
jgi:hypothetical protein